MTFKLKISLIIGLTMIVGISISSFVASSRVSLMGEEDLVQKSKAILSRVEVTRDYVARQGGFKLAMKKAIENYPDGNVPQEVKKEIVLHVPVYAAMEVGREESDKEHYEFRVFSDEPRNKDNKATVAELEILKKFEADPALAEIVETKNDKIYVYHPVRLSEKNGCLICHGDPSTSPFKNGKDILGFDMENWKDGKLHATFAVISDITPVRQASTRATWMIVGLSAFGGIFSLIIAYFFINKSVNRISKVAQELVASSAHVKSAGVEIANSAHDLSASTAEAASSIEETTASTEEVSSMIKLSADNANTAKGFSHQSEEQAKKGAEQVKKLILAMEEITKSSKRISEITSVIDDLAFQTNLLALNAAVEAARAGEQGRGFAVVAEAVRALAQRSSSSAKEISELISDSEEKVKQGSEIALRSGESLAEIVEIVEKVSRLNEEISTASIEQSTGISNINKAINEMDKVTQQNAAAAEKAASSSDGLSKQAEALNRSIDELQNIVYGKSDNEKMDLSVLQKPSGEFLPEMELNVQQNKNIKSVKSFDQAT